MQEGRRRWVKCLKATGQKAPCGGDFTKSAKEKATRARLHEDRARKANEAMFRANPDLVEAAIERLAEATMRLAEATHCEKLARPCDFATWAKAEKKRRGMVRLYERAVFAVQCIPPANKNDTGKPLLITPSAFQARNAMGVLHVHAQQDAGGRDFSLAKG